MKGLVGFILAIALLGAAVAVGIARETKHSEGACNFPWESQTTTSQTTASSRAPSSSK